MDSASFKDYLENRYFDQMRYYNKASGKNQTKYKRFQWILIVLSALTPIMAALDWDKINMQIPVIIISALVAILTTGLKTFQYQELWISYRSTQEMLKPEIYYYNFRVGPYGEEGVDREGLFISRVEAILDKEHQGWPPAKKLREEKGRGDAEIPAPNELAEPPEGS